MREMNPLGIEAGSTVAKLSERYLFSSSVLSPEALPFRKVSFADHLRSPDKKA